MPIPVRLTPAAVCLVAVAGFALGTFDADADAEVPRGRRGRRQSIDVVMNAVSSVSSVLSSSKLDTGKLGPDGKVSFINPGTFEPTSPPAKVVTTWQRKVFVLFDEPDSSPLAAVVGFAVLVLIFASTFSFCAETTEWANSHEAVKAAMDKIEIICILAFTAEYLIRLVCCQHRLTPNPKVLNYILKPMNLVDFLAIAPFYIELMLGAHMKTEVVRALRMTRIFRYEPKLRARRFAYSCSCVELTRLRAEF